MENQMFDNTFGLNKQALAVGSLLSGNDPDFAEWNGDQYLVEFESNAYKNGRERGIIIKMNHPHKKFEKCYNVAVFEHRVCDGIIAVFFESDQFKGWNSPYTADDVYGSEYNVLKNEGCSKTRKMVSVNYGEIGKMAHMIYEEFERFYQKEYDYTPTGTEEKESFQI